jgi:hypothetical protein
VLEGETLRERVKRGPMAPKKATDYGVQIAHGLAAAHEKGIVHRDLKPENLFVTKNSQIKTLDFGLAKLMHSESKTQLTQTLATEPGAVLGTVGYMSPEQVRGLAADHRADIFAFGAILYEMLTGRRAFSKPTSAETMSAILNEDPPPISQITPSVPPALERAVHRCLEKSPEQRFQSASDLAFALEDASDSGRATNHRIASVMPRTAWNWIAGAGMVLGILLGTLLWHLWAARKLTEKDTIILADFTNTTGDALFDGALRQGLAVQLEQSPFLSLVSDERVQEGLRLMDQPADAKLTPEIAREVCQRTGSAAVLDDSIAQIGTQYNLILKTINCASGEVLASTEARASDKNQVLDALGKTASKMRSKLGESLSTVQKFDVPLPYATTHSLEALKAFSMAMKTTAEKGEAASIPFFLRAIELDPDFALACAQLAAFYADLGEPGLGEKYATRAYRLRDRVSEREKLLISVIYYQSVTGELQKSIQTAEPWVQSYPRDASPHNFQSIAYEFLGQYEKEGL